jgi:alpha-tubulin suppressor-like RCC1 family protein
MLAAPSAALRAQITGPGVYSWGFNGSGQLGNGNTTSSTSPVAVTGGALSGVNVMAVIAGGQHSLALSTSGAVYAWGRNAEGELGIGNTTNSSLPVAVTAGGLSGVSVAGLAGGGFHTLARTSSGAVYAWGFNGGGQLGNGGTATATIPVLINGGGLSGVNVTGVAAGRMHSLARTSSGAVYAWGQNDRGEVGNGSTTNATTPTLITGGGLSTVNVTSIAAGDQHSLAVTSTGALYTWGFNFSGQLGNGNTTSSSTPVLITGGGLSGATVVAAAAGSGYSLALTNTGAVYAWGDNSSGNLGTGNTTNSLTPVLISFPANGSAKVVSLAAHQGTSFALESDGSLWAWGLNSNGDYGNGTTTNSLSPLKVYTPAAGSPLASFATMSSSSHGVAFVAPVPEPGCTCLAVAAASVFGARRLRRRRIAVSIDRKGGDKCD